MSCLDQANDRIETIIIILNLLHSAPVTFIHSTQDDWEHTFERFWIVNLTSPFQTFWLKACQNATIALALTEEDATRNTYLVISTEIHDRMTTSEILTFWLRHKVFCETQDQSGAREQHLH